MKQNTKNPVSGIAAGTGSENQLAFINVVKYSYEGNSFPYEVGLQERYMIVKPNSGENPKKATKRIRGEVRKALRYEQDLSVWVEKAIIFKGVVYIPI